MMHHASTYVREGMRSFKGSLGKKAVEVKQ